MEENSPAGYGDLFFSIIVAVMLLEVAIGFVQLIGALIRTAICFSNKQPIGKLKTYWIMVGIYFLVFAGMYYSREILSNYIFRGGTNYNVYWKWHMTLLYVQIAWIILAWGIAIWHCIQIVFVKRKNTIEINNSLTK